MGGIIFIPPMQINMKTMIWSRYNEFIQSHDSFSLFNCRTKKWVNLVPELYRILIDKKNYISELENIHPSLFKVLVENQFLVPNAEYEISECIRTCISQKCLLPILEEELKHRIRYSHSKEG